MARREVYAGELPIQQQGDILLQDGVLAVSNNVIEAPVKGGMHDDYLAELAFMEEPVEIMVMESSDENADNPVQVGNNGQFVQFFRGVPTVTRRKFVDCLIAKNTRVTTPEVPNGAGERTRAIRQISALRYPFTVISDTNPKGAEWLKRRMAETV